MSTLHDGELRALLEALPPDEAPAAAPGRQPTTVLYGGAHRFSAQTPEKLGKMAREFFARWTPDPGRLAAAVGFDEARVDVARVHELLEKKLAREPLEDLRIDFEDGLGAVTDDEEDELATRTGEQLAVALARSGAPPFAGLRVRSLGPSTRARALRTLDRFLTGFSEAGGRTPLRVTLPKVEDAREVEVLARALETLEERLGLTDSVLEVMVETPRGLFEGGRLRLPSLLEAGQGRVDSVHFGTYDFTGALGVVAGDQRADHPACELARMLLQMGLAGSGVRLCDGALHRLPLVVHRAAGAGEKLSERQEEENRRAVESGLRLHATQIRAALDKGIFQGWDLHPSQLIARYAALFAFFREGLERSALRMRGYVERGEVGAATGTDWDDAASVRGLLNLYRRGYGCGALDEADLQDAGLKLSDVEA